jgi:hypothetical protein
MRRPLLSVGLVGSSFFLIGGAPAAIAAIIVASIPAILLTRHPPETGLGRR